MVHTEPNEEQPMVAESRSLKELFLAALAVAPAERDAWLRQECAEDAGLRRRVEQMLAAHEMPQSLLDRLAPAAECTETATTRDPAVAARSAMIELEDPGALLAGRYKLLEVIGEGGMGTVWMAEQKQPVKRLVAVKLIKAGMDSRTVLARFEAERQALALMDHPNIAKVLDGGATPEGRPYFVMELVKGVPITRYCDDRHLTPRQRLELFLPVCQAVQHAHQKGVIHRDLKPSNVLIALYDDKPVPQVIDFGVAKAAGEPLTERTLHTGFGAVVGTIEYMSPEQASFNQLDVDTRSDVYSLGVLLYELLTGATPLGRKELETVGMLETLRLIREQEPVRPSTRLSTADALPALAAKRGTEPAHLARQVRGDLDWIVMKALEKDRSRRYETATAFAADLLRYLADEPVQACPPTAGYRLRKFARRNRAAVLTAAAVAASLVAGAAVAAAMAVRATRAETAEAEQRRSAERNEEDAVAAAAQEKQAREQAQEERKKAEEALKRERLTSYVHRVALAQREWQANEVGRARQLLDECPAELRHWEWRYVRRLCDTEFVAFRGHGEDVGALAFSPDGKRVASASASGVRVWDSATGKEAFKVAGKGGAGVAFRRDGQRFAVAWARSITVHDAADGKELLRITAHDKLVGRFPFPARVTAVAFSPDGKRLATASSSERVGGPHGYPGGEVKVWDAETGKELGRFDDLPHAANGVAFSPDGKLLAASTRGAGGELPDAGQVRVWDANGRLLHTFRPYEKDKVDPGQDTYFLSDVAFSPDSSRVAAAGSDGAIRVWGLAAEREELVLRGHNKTVLTIGFDPQGKRLVSGGSDRTVRVWDLDTGKEALVLQGHARAVQAAAFSPDGRRVASAGGEVRVWDATSDQQARTFYRPPTATGVYSVVFSPDGKLLAEASVSEVKIRDVATGQQRRHIKPIGPGGLGPYARVAFSPDGTAVATTGNRGIALWDAATGKETRLFPDNPKIAQWPYTIAVGMAFRPDGRRLATVGKGLLTLWDTATAKELQVIQADVGAVAYSPDGLRLATATKEASRFEKGDDGRMRRVRVPAEVKLWDVESGKVVRTIPGGGLGVVFSPDGKRLASWSQDGVITVWDAGDGRPLLTLRGHTGEVFGAAFSPDGRRLVSGGQDQTVRLWDAHGGMEVLTLRGHGAPVVSVAFSPDGRHIASASADKPTQVKLWDAGR
jgi:eukaryotic-like serine/threonine-protein kinase